jgi:hypothetical protein
MFTIGHHLTSHAIGYPDLDLDAYGRDLVTLFERMLGVES